jgi:hypothetical protein
MTEKPSIGRPTLPASEGLLAEWDRPALVARRIGVRISSKGACVMACVASCLSSRASQFRLLPPAPGPLDARPLPVNRKASWAAQRQFGPARKPRMPTSPAIQTYQFEFWHRFSPKTKTRTFKRREKHLNATALLPWPLLRMSSVRVLQRLRVWFVLRQQPTINHRGTASRRLLSMGKWRN